MTYVLPPALARLRERLPGLRPAFTVGDEAAVLAALREHRVDLALVTDRAPRDGLELEPFADDHLVLLGADDLQALSARTLVTRAAGAADRRAADALLRDAGVRPRDRLVAETLEAVKACVRAGLGAALVPGCAAAGEGTPVAPLRYCLARRAGEAPPLAAPLLDALRR